MWSSGAIISVELRTKTKASRLGGDDAANFKNFAAVKQKLAHMRVRWRFFFSFNQLQLEKFAWHWSTRATLGF